MAGKTEENMSGEKGKKMSCLAKVKAAFRLTEEGATPPNWKVIAIMIFSLVSQFISKEEKFF